MPAPITAAQRKELKKLGERVKKTRQAMGLTLEEVAKSIGKDRQSIHRLENGEFNPSYIYLMEVSKGMGVHISELLDDKTK